jgi:long-chain acyl-CoA synthetase
LCVASLTHAFGNHMLATAFRLGASLCTTTRIDTATELSEIRSLDPSVIPILPRVQRSVFLQRSAQGPKLPSERVFGPRAAFLCTAGCKPNYDVLRYVSAGVQIIEFYGSTEASVVAVTPRGEWREGSAGVLASDVEARVSADGELEVRSPGVTPGYIGAESAFTPDGYFMTGDAAEIDGDRRLRIVGRKRDVFNTPEGSNIYPARIEEMLEMLPWVDQAFLFGDARPFLTALIVMRDRDGWTSARDDGFLELANAGPAYREAGSWLAGINNRLERVEQIVRFGLLAREFPLDVYATVTAGKVRRDRAAALRVYGSVLDHLYSSDVHPVPDDSFVPGADRRMRLRGK